MPQKYLIKTKRLGLRTWKGSDLKSFAKMNADPKVMHYFPNLLTEAQSKAYFDRINQHYEQHGFTVYAVDKLDINQFIGYIGFACPRFESFFTPCVEIGWRLDARVWNQGLATEGGACLLGLWF